MRLALNVPNQITLGRLLLAILFVTLLSQYSQLDPNRMMLLVAAGIFVVAAVSDFFDGYLARRWGQVTDLGRVLDPLVDKVLVCGAFILFVGPSFVDAEGQNVTEVRAWMVVVIVGRELLVTGLRGFSESGGRAFGSAVYGKLKMWMQSIAAPAILVIVAFEPALEGSMVWIKKTLVWLTVLATVLSTATYLARSRDLLTSREQAAGGAHPKGRAA